MANCTIRRRTWTTPEGIRRKYPIGSLRRLSIQSSSMAYHSLSVKKLTTWAIIWLFGQCQWQSCLRNCIAQLCAEASKLCSWYLDQSVLLFSNSYRNLARVFATGENRSLRTFTLLSNQGLMKWQIKRPITYSSIKFLINLLSFL